SRRCPCEIREIEYTCGRCRETNSGSQKLAPGRLGLGFVPCRAFFFVGRAGETTKTRRHEEEGAKIKPRRHGRPEGGSGFNGSPQLGFIGSGVLKNLGHGG